MSHSSNHNSKKKSAKVVSEEVNENNHETSSEESFESQSSVEADTSIQMSDSEAQTFEETADTHIEDKVKIEFPYSDLVRAKIPKAFDVAEKVATDWKNQGEFKDLGLPHPLVDALAAEALKKAKNVEKKLEEKGVFTIAKMGIEVAKSQINQLRKKSDS